MDAYVDYSKCKLNITCKEQIIDILDMTDFKETKDCTKKDIFDGIKNVLIYNGVNFDKCVKDFGITVI